MADQAITALPKKTYSGSSQIASTDYLLGIDSAEGYQMLIQDLGEYIINRATASLAGSTQTLASAISALNSKSNTYIGTATGSNRQEFVQNLVTLINNKFPLANLANGTVLTGSATWSGQGYCGYVVTRNSGGANITVQIGGEIVSALIDTRNLAISAFTDLNSNISRSQIAQNSNLNSYTSGGSQRYYKGIGIGTMTNRPPEETNVNFPFALDVINVDGYDKQILHVYTSNGNIRMYERIQYYEDGNKIYASWFLKPAQTVVTGSNAVATTHTISSAVVLKIGQLVVANIDITATSDIAAWSNFFTIKNTNLVSNVYGHLYTDGHTETVLCSQYGQVQGSRAISNGSHALVTLVGVLSR